MKLGLASNAALQINNVTREGLILAFQDRYAIVGAFNQPVWDLMFTVSCGPLGEDLKPDLITFVQIQVKNREEATGSKDMLPQEMKYRELILDQERIPELGGEGSAATLPQQGGKVDKLPTSGRKPRPGDVFTPRHPPMLMHVEIAGKAREKKTQVLPEILASDPEQPPRTG